MKQFLFNTIATVAGFLIGINLAVGNGIGTAVAFLCNSVSLGMKWVAEHLLRWIDAERYDYINAATQQRFELTELNLLMAANQIKEDALAGKVWTAHHTNALNVIANQLHQSCGWEIVKVHAYLRPLVESIPGMGYTSEDDQEGATC